MTSIRRRAVASRALSSFAALCALSMSVYYFREAGAAQGQADARFPQFVGSLSAVAPDSRGSHTAERLDRSLANAGFPQQGIRGHDEASDAVSSSTSKGLGYGAALIGVLLLAGWSERALAEKKKRIAEDRYWDEVKKTHPAMRRLRVAERSADQLKAQALAPLNAFMATVGEPSNQHGQQSALSGEMATISRAAAFSGPGSQFSQQNREADPDSAASTARGRMRF